MLNNFIYYDTKYELNIHFLYFLFLKVSRFMWCHIELYISDIFLKLINWS